MLEAVFLSNLRAMRETMLGGAPLLYWLVFHVAVVALLACDLFFLNRREGRARNRGNAGFTLLLALLAGTMVCWLARTQGREAGLEFASGYLIELFLSIDNLFVFFLIFRSLGIAAAEQRKALLAGAAGAILLRGAFIVAGISLFARFAWVQYLFGALLLAAAARLGKGRKLSAPPGMRVVRIAQRFGGGSTAALVSAVIAVELADIVFALDSVPAVLAVSHRPFVVYTSNICAILGLRSLYFLLAAALERLRFLHFSLAAILGFVGVKMLLERLAPIPVGASLGVIIALAAAGAGASLLLPARASSPPGPGAP